MPVDRQETIKRKSASMQTSMMIRGTTTIEIGLCFAVSIAFQFSINAVFWATMWIILEEGVLEYTY